MRQYAKKREFMKSIAKIWRDPKYQFNKMDAEKKIRSHPGSMILAKATAASGTRNLSVLQRLLALQLWQSKIKKINHPYHP